MSQRHAMRSLVAAATLLASAACAGGELPQEVQAPQFATVSANSTTADEILAFMDGVNAGLAAQNADYRIAVAEYITLAGSAEIGATLIARDLGNKRLDEDFVPFDSRRSWSGPAGGAADNLTFAIDQTGDAVPVFGGLTGAQTTAAIRRAMATWDGVSCSNLPINEVSSFGLDLGIVAFLSGLGGSGFVVADVMHTGWRDINFAGGVLAATFTFIFTGPGGVPTDVDADGRDDTAFREIYYDRSFLWAINSDVDVESVALHEAGHALSQAHFGNIFIRHNGSLDASPRAVMNALYDGVQQKLRGTDNGGHCGNWAAWPNK